MVEKEEKGPKLHPTLSGNSQGQPLFEYFRARLPNGLSSKAYEHGLGCDGYSRLIANELGGPKKARIYEIERPMPTDPGETLRHSYVVPENANPADLAFNNTEGEFKTARQVRREGRDITDEVFSTPWENL